MEPLQPQAFPIDSQRQRRVPQLATLLCAVQPSALSTFMQSECELAHAAVPQRLEKSAVCASMHVMGVLEQSCGMPEQEQVCCWRPC